MNTHTSYTEIFSKLLQANTKECSLSEYLSALLKILGTHTGMLRCTLCFLDTKHEEMYALASFGLQYNEIEKAHYKLGEGIIGTVARTGTPMIIPNVQNEPRFLNRTKARDLEHSVISFICVPIFIDGQVRATLSADRENGNIEQLKQDIELLQLVAYLIIPRLSTFHGISEQEEIFFEDSEFPFISYSDKMKKILKEIQQVAPFDTTVLIRGESGTGKELIAAYIQKKSPRADKPFIKINCAALPENLIESELFGYEKGAFTGAAERHKGKFELAHTGTLFLDELGDMSLATQAKLLRVLQEKEFERLGGTETISVDVRIIAATNKNLEEMVKERKFRRDLFYRLSVFPLYTYPLRERKEDIIPLANYFIDNFCKKNKTKIAKISPAVIEKLLSYPWYGNIRELANIMERAVILSSEKGIIEIEALPDFMLQNNQNQSMHQTKTLDESLEEVEKELIQSALTASKGNMAKACKVLGITERMLGIRMKKYALDYKQFRI